ncbi:MAG: hypothetical protein U9N55_01965 [candidate division Zixibacteria bacterium]|nr:hypothetical protein [candidate division Zixibacteria bacterium]
MYLTTNAERTKVDVENARYIPGVILVDPQADEKVVSGDSSVIIMNMGFRGNAISNFTSLGIKFDEYVKYRLYLQLHGKPDTTTTILKENSYLWLLKHYELESRDKLFLPVSGTCAIDSVSSHKMYGTIDGHFENAKGATVKIDGRFKVKM